MNDPFINMLHNAVANEIRKDAEGRGQFTLGMLKEKLKDCDPKNPCFVDTDGSPCGVSSYRGHYDQLAIERDKVVNIVQDVIDILDFATGKTYTGYKGGEYTMNDYTMIWVSEYGEASGLAVVGVDEKDDKVIIRTVDTYAE